MRDYDAMLGALAARARLPFSWRDNDCARFAAAIVEAETGKRPLRGLRWSTPAGARRVVERLGGIEAAVSARLRSILPASAQRGDVAGVPDEALGLCLMIVEGETLVGPGDDGIVRVPRARMVSAWSAE